ncbi:MAG: hypothetical protein AB1Z23_12245 [Eubacteriales bacterium]
MIIRKTLMTLLTKPWILLLSLVIGMVPYMLAGIFAGEYMDYTTSAAIIKMIFIILLMGPFVTYTFEACNGDISDNWFSKGLFKNTLKVLIIIIITRLILPWIKAFGLIYGYRIVGAYIFVWDFVIMTFEAVALIAVISTHSFADAIDMATNETKSIFLKVAALAAIFMVLEFALFPWYTEDTTDISEMEVYVAELDATVELESLSDDTLSEMGIDKSALTADSYLKEAASYVFYGLFDSISNAVILVFCAYNFLETRKIVDDAMARLKEY